MRTAIPVLLVALAVLVGGLLAEDAVRVRLAPSLTATAVGDPVAKYNADGSVSMETPRTDYRDAKGVTQRNVTYLREYVTKASTFALTTTKDGKLTASKVIAVPAPAAGRAAVVEVVIRVYADVAIPVEPLPDEAVEK